MTAEQNVITLTSITQIFTILDLVCRGKRNTQAASQVGFYTLCRPKAVACWIFARVVEPRPNVGHKKPAVVTDRSWFVHVVPVYYLLYVDIIWLHQGLKNVYEMVKLD